MQDARKASPETKALQASNLCATKQYYDMPQQAATNPHVHFAHPSALCMQRCLHCYAHLSAGSEHVAKSPTPCRDSKAMSVNADNIDDEDAAPRGGRYERPPPARLSLLMAVGRLGPATGKPSSSVLHAWYDHNHT